MRALAPTYILCGALIGALATVRAPTRAQEAAPAGDPFETLRGCVSLTSADLRRLDDRQVVAEVLPGANGDVSVFAARRLSADGDRLLVWVDAIDQLKRSPAVHAIGRFSDPPRRADLAGLPIDDADVTALLRCRPGDCGFKLTAQERQQVQQAGPAGVPDTLRDVLVARVEAHRQGGLRALGRYDDGRTPLGLADASEAVVARLPCLGRNVPELARMLSQDPRIEASPLLAFYYWSKEEFRGRPVLLVTRVLAARQQVAGRTETIVAGRQLYAAHYLNAGLNLTGVIDVADGRHYLFVLNRTSVDVIGGLFSGVVRSVVERRLRADVTTVIEQVGRRLEGGLPVR